MTLNVVCEKLRRTWFMARHRRSFAAIGARTWLVEPFRVDGAENITIGAGTLLQRGGWLYCEAVGSEPASLRIGAGCVFGYNNHITAVGGMVIGDDVLTANNVYISDNVHGYEDVRTPIMHQPVRFKRAVGIGSGSWIGENACIIGASIGRNCVIGANAVVTRDIPDFSVAVGIPAVVISQYDRASGEWSSAAGA